VFKKYLPLALSLVLVFIVFNYFFIEVWIDFQLAESPLKQWTIMVYLDADNDIDLGLFESPYGSKGIADFNEMEMVGSTSDVAVVVQMDRLNSSAVRYLVMKDNDTRIVGSPMLQDLGEVNMGDPDTLTDFIRWAVTNFWARRYCLIIWDHGLGFQGVCKDWNGVSPPPTPVENLTMTELKSALSKITNEIARPIDIIGFDACLMQMTEVAYQIRNYATVMVGSEETIPGYGWPYHYILQNLTNTPYMGVSQFAQKIVGAYRDYYKSHSTIYYDGSIIPTTRLTLSAVNLTQINALSMTLNNFASRLIDKYSVLRDELMRCRNLAQEFMTGELVEPWYYVDLYNFTQLVYSDEDISDLEVKTTARNLMETINKTVIFEWHDLGRYKYLRYFPRGKEETEWFLGCPGSHGLSIYFPKNSTHYHSSYSQLDISTESCFYWNKFLKVYLEIG